MDFGIIKIKNYLFTKFQLDHCYFVIDFKASKLQFRYWRIIKIKNLILYMRY